MTQTQAEPGSAGQPSFEELAQAVDAAAAKARALDEGVRGPAEDLRRAVEAVHRAGLVAIVRRLRDDPTGRELLFELVDEPVVHLLLLLHGIIRLDPMSQALTVLDRMRPQLQSGGGDVELVRITDGTAYVRLSGAYNRCSASSVTMRQEVEDALIGQVEAISAVEVLPNDSTPTLIPLSALTRRDDDGWIKTRPAVELADGEVTSMRLVTRAGTEMDVVVVNIGGLLRAYRDACAHQGLPLGGALVDPEAGTLTCPWHGFCYDALSGECMSAPGAQLEQMPLRVDDGDVWIRVAG